MPQKCRNYCFTLNNPTFEEVHDIVTSGEYRYCIFGFEVGEKGTEHLQGYMEFDHQKRLSEAKIIERMHLESRKGTQKQAIEYCKKEGDFYEFGEMKEQGKRTDMDDIKNLIDNGGTLEDVASQYFGQYIRYNFNKYVDMKKKLNHGECDVYLVRKFEEGDPYEFVAKNDNVFLCDNGDLSAYAGEPCIVYVGWDSRIFHKWCRNIPTIVKYGFENRTIMPRTCILYEAYLKNDPIVDLMTLIGNASEVSGGNTDGQAITPDCQEEDDEIISI